MHHHFSNEQAKPASAEIVGMSVPADFSMRVLWPRRPAVVKKFPCLKYKMGKGEIYGEWQKKPFMELGSFKFEDQY